jgi:starch synthase
MRRCSISIVTNGRFWLLDLARELASLDHEISFYSCVPQDRCNKFGLPAEAWRPVPAPCYVLYKLAQITTDVRWTALIQAAVGSLLGRSVRRRVRRLDLLIALSGLTSRHNMSICRKSGARLWIERGSRHYLSQVEILSTIPTYSGYRPPKFGSPTNELLDYANADRIVVPARHCVESFIDHDVEENRLFRNPYGVDLKMFAPTVKPTVETLPTIIMVGRWSYRKGCDLLVNAWRGMRGVQLLHVGPVDDCPLPKDENFQHVDSVEQFRLRDYYGRSHVMALLSREEGLALVQAQALSCGLRLVCSDRTGGEDLGKMMSTSDAVTVVPTGNVIAQKLGMQRALAKAMADPAGLRNRLGAAASELSWEAYGRRYSDALSADFARVKAQKT